MNETDYKCLDCKGKVHEPIFSHILDMTELFCPLCKKWFQYWWRNGSITEK